MSDIESEYSDYLNQRDAEGGSHPGRADPSRAMLWTVGAVVLLLLGGVAVLALFG